MSGESVSLRVSRAEVQALVEAGLGVALEEALVADSPQGLHAARSRAFVIALSAALRTLYSDPDVVALNRFDDRARQAVGMNELLHDITVCRLAEVPSASRGIPLWYVAEPLWQVESELARDTRQALIDFNKLVLGSAPCKLFVGPNVRDPDGFVGVLKPAAKGCTGDVFVALIPHPDAWDRGDREVRVIPLRVGA